MNLAAVGCSFRTAPVDVRERLAIPADRVGQALLDLLARTGGEVAILSTCNRLEVYLADDGDRPVGGLQDVAALLADRSGLPADVAATHLVERRGPAAVRHLFRVAASLDSLVVGEGQIAGQVKRAYELANLHSAAGPVLHALFQHARVAAKRARRETGIGQGHVSVPSVAVDYVRQVFDRFHDKTVLLIGAGKMGERALTHLRELGPRRVLVTNRSPAKAEQLAGGCGGAAVPWDKLDAALVEADIVLSTTGAPETVVSAARFAPVLAKRGPGPMVILDIAVPRDFDPAIHDGERVCLFNIDDLTRIRETTLAARLKHVAPAEAIVEAEGAKFAAEWSRRRTGPVIAQLTRDFDRKRQAVVAGLLGKLNGKLSDADRQYVEGAFRLLQNQFLHGPISAVGEASRGGGGAALVDALRQLFRLGAADKASG